MPTTTTTPKPAKTAAAAPIPRRTKAAAPPVDPVAHHQALVERIDTGEHVDPLELARAEAAVRAVEIRQAGDTRREAEAAEAGRLARIRAIHDELVDGDLHAQAAEIVARYDTAVAALADLRAAAVAFYSDFQSRWRELRRLGTADGVDISVGGDARDPRITLDGRHLFVHVDDAERLVDVATAAALRRPSRLATVEHYRRLAH